MSWFPADPRQRRLLWGILGLALALRVGAACGLQYLLDHRWHREFLIAGDAQGYWELAKTIAQGEDYAVHHPPRYVHRMPGFPELLAISILLFGENLLAAKLVLACVGTVACWLVYVLGRKLTDEPTGLLSAGLAAVSPVFIAFSVIELSETAFAAAMLLSLISVHAVKGELARETVRTGTLVGLSLLTGATVALGCYFHPSWLLAAPLFGVLLIVVSSKRSTAVLTGGLLVLGMILALLPWGIRNQRVSGHFTLTTFWMGLSLYDGLNPHANGESNMRFFDEEGFSTQMTEYEVDQHYRRQSWEFVRNNPGRTASLALVKLWRFWKPWPNAAQFGSVWASLVVGVFFVPMVIAAVWGSVRMFIRSQGERIGRLTSPARRGTESASRVGLSTDDSSILNIRPSSFILHPSSPIWSVAILAGPILYFAALHTVFVSSLRYRLPAEYPLLVLSAYGILDGWARLRTRSKT